MDAELFSLFPRGTSHVCLRRYKTVNVYVFFVRLGPKPSPDNYMLQVGSFVSGIVTDSRDTGNELEHLLQVHHKKVS